MIVRVLSDPIQKDISRGGCVYKSHLKFKGMLITRDAS